MFPRIFCFFGNTCVSICSQFSQPWQCAGSSNIEIYFNAAFCETQILLTNAKLIVHGDTWPGTWWTIGRKKKKYAVHYTKQPRYRLLRQFVNLLIFSSLVRPSLLPDTYWRLISWLGFTPSLPVILAIPNSFSFIFLFLKKHTPHTPHTHTVISPCGMLHAPRDPLLISKAPHTPPPKTDFMSLNQNCSQRTISTKLLRMSWSAVLLIRLSSQSSPGIHSCLLRLGESTLENITHGRIGGEGFLFFSVFFFIYLIFIF